MTTSLPRWRRWVLRHLPASVLREPFALWLALVCMLSAVLQFAGLSEPGSIARLLPVVVIKAWNVELLVGGALTLAGILANRPRVLILGLQPLGLAALAYAVTVVYVAGWRGVFAALIMAAFGLACFVKAFTYSSAALGQLPRAGGR
jgi:uncharacterized membrane protein